MPRLGKTTKTSVDVKRITIDYEDWLSDGETLTAVTFEVVTNDDDVTTTDLTVTNPIINPADLLSVAVYLNGGVNNAAYKVLSTAVTSGAQTKEDYVLVFVKNP